MDHLPVLFVFHVFEMLKSALNRFKSPFKSGMADEKSLSNCLFICDLFERNIDHLRARKGKIRTPTLHVWMIGMICRKEIFVYHHEIDLNVIKMKLSYVLFA